MPNASHKRSRFQGLAVCIRALWIFNLYRFSRINTDILITFECVLRIFTDLYSDLGCIYLDLGCISILNTNKKVTNISVSNLYKSVKVTNSEGPDVCMMINIVFLVTELFILLLVLVVWTRVSWTRLASPNPVQRTHKTCLVQHCKMAGFHH